MEYDSHINFSSILYILTHKMVFIVWRQNVLVRLQMEIMLNV